MIFDCWIEQRLRYLSDEHQRLGSGIIGAHYLRCAGALYAEFRFTGQQHDRFRTWLAIRTCCQWLCQLGRGQP
jgi:hypothetical protein